MSLSNDKLDDLRLPYNSYVCTRCWQAWGSRRAKRIITCTPNSIRSSDPRQQ
ncbi:unnamed protein product [Schistosoma curassoni]|uniref:DUF2256 domain-containing protein n=1 Tax=Schistosoma curassoni TaxID=6186 RepID=A0A183JNL3_9TREM|nr:unnamed protein product [Schistosoma curassoni]